MPDRDALRELWQGGSEGDLRFQFDVIKGLADSIRQMTGQMADMQKTQVDMLVRMARLEENKVGDALVKLEGSVAAQEVRIDALFRDKDRRDGAMGVIGAVKGWWPIIVTIASLVSALWLVGRSAGIVPAPPTPAIVQREVHPEAKGSAGNVH